MSEGAQSRFGDSARIGGGMHGGGGGGGGGCSAKAVGLQASPIPEW